MNDNSTTTIIDDPDAPIPLPPPPEATDAPPGVDPNILPLMLWTLDLPWPEDANANTFSFDIPFPAMFQRAVRAEVPSPIHGGRRKAALRLIWLVAVNGTPVKTQFFLQRAGIAVNVSLDGIGPKMLGVVVSPMGEPMALWHMPPMPQGVEERTEMVSPAEQPRPPLELVEPR